MAYRASHIVISHSTGMSSDRVWKKMTNYVELFAENCGKCIEMHVCGNSMVNKIDKHKAFPLY